MYRADYDLSQQMVASRIPLPSMIIQIHQQKLWPGIPVTVDEGVVVIKNGKIISGEHTVMIKAIFSNANKVKSYSDHVKF